MTSSEVKAHSESHLPIRIVNNFRPAASLPTELLVIIFEFACGADPDGDPGGRHRTINRSVRHIICTTCYVWRSVAFDTPSLWCRIPIRVDKGVASCSLSLVEREIERAAWRLIMLKVMAFSESGPWKELRSLLHGALSRCESISMFWGMETLDDSFLVAPGRNYAPIHFPHLHTLYLSLNYSGSGPTGSPHRDATTLDLTLAPQLQELAINRLGILVRVGSGNNITRLLLILNVFVDDDIFLLRHCRKLRELSWYPTYSGITTPQLAELAKTDLSHLLHLSYDLYPTPETQAILQALSAPQLRSLCLGYEIMPLQNQFSNLESLFIGDFHSEMGVIPVLRAVPSIRSLTLEFTLNPTLEGYLQVLLERDEYGRFEVLPLLRDLMVWINWTAIGWVDAIIHLRNNGEPENPNMTFVLHLPRSSSGAVERNEGLDDLRDRHPWSIDDRVVYKDRFNEGSQSGWSVLDY